MSANPIPFDFVHQTSIDETIPVLAVGRHPALAEHRFDDVFRVGKNPHTPRPFERFERDGAG